MKDGSEPLGIMGMINRQLRLMALARDLTEQGIPQSQWEKSWGFTSEFVARKTAAQARRRTKAQLDLMYDLALEADLSVKKGRNDPEHAVEILTAQLANLT
jgi:DNA polymerase-3 subunit delta